MVGKKEDVAEHIGVLARGLANYANKAGLIEVARYLELAAVETDKLAVAPKKRDRGFVS